MATIFVVAEAAEADGRPRCERREQLDRLAAFRPSQQFPLVTIEKSAPYRRVVQILRVNAFEQSRARRQGRKPDIEVASALPVCPRHAPRRVARYADPQPFVAPGRRTDVKRAELERFCHAHPAPFTISPR